jgi:hypothetical protein
LSEWEFSSQSSMNGSHNSFSKPNQREDAMKGIIIGIAAMFVGIIVIAAIAIGTVAIEKFNWATQQETSIQYSYKDLQNIKSSYTAKVKEMAQIPDMYADKLKEVVSAAIEGRYGKDGSRAVMQWIQEQNPTTIDTKMFERVQLVIESGRNDFETAQRKHLELMRVYETQLKTFPGNVILGTVLRFPKINLADYQIIVLKDVQKQFETHTDETLDLKGDK